MTTTATRSIDALFARYDASHRHPVNKAIHWICVPAITWSVLAMLWWLSPFAAYALLVLAAAFYLWLSWPIALGMVAVVTAMLLPIARPDASLGYAAVVVFVVAWIGQFVGHRIENRKPSFVDDVKFLLIGPAWLVAAIYRALGIRY